jgi:MoaA/NifB/PqqE/SkfB family radical SAM enzyme
LNFNTGLIRPLHNIGVLEAASGCNLRCPSCVSWTEKGKDFLTLQQAQTAVEKFFKPLGILQIQLYWRGDPCINPALPEIAAYVRGAGFKTIVSTNGVTKWCGQPDYMTKLLHNLDHYAVCLDGWNPDNIAKYRVGSKWETMWRNMDLMKSIETNCDKILAVLMFKHNQGKEDYFLEVAHKYGMRVEFKAPDILGHYLLTEELANEWLSDEEKYSRYDRIDTKDLPNNIEWRGDDIDTAQLGEYVWVHRSTATCDSGNFIVAADGSIPPCGQFTRTTNGLGTINNSLEEIMANYKAMNTDMQARKLPECGNQCLCLVRPR